LDGKDFFYFVGIISVKMRREKKRLQLSLRYICGQILKKFEIPVTEEAWAE